MKSKNYEKIKKYYEAHIWSLERIKSLVGKTTGITKEELEEMIEEDYKKEGKK